MGGSAAIIGSSLKPSARVCAQQRIKSAARGHAIHKLHILEYLERARLDAFAARTGERHGDLLDNLESNAAPRQLDAERQTGGTCAADQNIGRNIAHHRGLHICVLCT